MTLMTEFKFIESGWDSEVTVLYTIVMVLIKEN